MRKVCLRCGSKFVHEAQYCPHDGSLLLADDEIPDPLIGTVLLEQFRIDEQIGTGGMGTVYRAHQITMGRDVAVKVLRQELARDGQAVARFEREAKLAISLDHPNLVRVYLSGRLPDGRLYIVMELLEGRSLADELDHFGAPSIERAVLLIMKLCAALGAMHGSGIIHRDIKPENVYLVRRGRDEDYVKLVDFGIARVLQAESGAPTTTQNGRVFGTATYISPEAATGDETDARSDIYSLGVLAYQLLTGELPFEGSTAGAILMQHVHQAPPPLRTKGKGAEVPEGLARIVMRALSKDPAERHQSLAEFLDAVAEAASRAGLLRDARPLLLGTVWGDELLAPGSYLADLLSSSNPPSAPAAVSETPPAVFVRDPREEALLSSAPKPFETTAHDLAVVRRSKRRKRGWLWTSIAMVALVLVGVAASAHWRRSSVKALPESKAPERSASASQLAAEPLPIDASLVETLPVTDGPPMTDAPPATDVSGTSAETGLEGRVPEPAERAEASSPPPPRASKKRPTPARAQRDKARDAASGSSVSTDRSADGSDTNRSPASSSAVELEPDEGIDWTVPGFPDERATGMPDAPARNPIVIDEPPTR